MGELLRGLREFCLADDFVRRVARPYFMLVDFGVPHCTDYYVIEYVAMGMDNQDYSLKMFTPIYVRHEGTLAL